MSKKIMPVIGTRPEAIKLAPVINGLEEYPKEFELITVTTAQHRQMLDQVLKLCLDPLPLQNQRIPERLWRTFGLKEIVRYDPNAEFICLVHLDLEELKAEKQSHPIFWGALRKIETQENMVAAKAVAISLSQKKQKLTSFSEGIPEENIFGAGVRVRIK